MLKDWALVPTWCNLVPTFCRPCLKSINAAEENQYDDSSEPYLGGRRNKKAALPVMMEERPGGEEGDRSVGRVRTTSGSAIRLALGRLCGL
jgi:hypothetical protein